MLNAQKCSSVLQRNFPTDMHINCWGLGNAQSQVLNLFNCPFLQCSHPYQILRRSHTCLCQTSTLQLLQNFLTFQVISGITHTSHGLQTKIQKSSASERCGLTKDRTGPIYQQHPRPQLPCRLPIFLTYSFPPNSFSIP